jgi:hypothetical protein
LIVSAKAGATSRETASRNMESERAVFFIIIFLRVMWLERECSIDCSEA